MKSLMIILTCGFISYFLTSVHSASSFAAVLMPITFVFSLLALACWLIVWRWNRRFGGDREIDIAELGIEGELAAVASVQAGTDYQAGESTADAKVALSNA